MKIKSNSTCFGGKFSFLIKLKKNMTSALMVIARAFLFSHSFDRNLPKNFAQIFIFIESENASQSFSLSIY